MGSIRPSNIKRISEELVENNKDTFNEDFHHNKEMLAQFLDKSVAKKTVNAIAGYITRYILKKKSKEKNELEQLGLA
ncbi:MAG: 30S ribosomal protein S17e [Ferroplasma sp.]